VVLVAHRVQELQVGIQVLTVVRLLPKAVFIILALPLRLQALGFLVVMVAFTAAALALVLAGMRVREEPLEIVLLRLALVAQVVAVFLI
jgi:hypothetical protein